MLTHPDVETQTIFTLLEKQRDDALIAAGQSAAKVTMLEAELARLQEPPALEPEPEAAAVN